MSLIIKRRVEILLLAGAVFIFAIIGGYMFRTKGSKRIYPIENVTWADPVYYRQDDPQWAEDTLGQSEYTLGESGCLIACIAADLEMELSDGQTERPDWAGEQITPGSLNQRFTQQGAYDKEGNLLWNRINEAGEIQAEAGRKVSYKQITEALQEKNYPIVRVRRIEIGNFHYVLIVKSEGGMFYCMDPLKEEEKLVPLEEFGNRVYAVRYVGIADEKNVQGD